MGHTHGSKRRFDDRSGVGKKIGDSVEKPKKSSDLRVKKKTTRGAATEKNVRTKREYGIERDERSERRQDDSMIRTRADREYIPFDSEFDEDYDDYSAKETEDAEAGYRKNGRGGTGKKAAPIPGAVAGRNAVRELLKSGRSVDKIFVKSGSREGSIVVIVAEAVNRKIPIVEATEEKLSIIAGGTNHQGVVALAAQKQYSDVDDILKIAKERNETPLIVAADGIEDPHNLGALIRCAECAGAHGIIIPKRRAVGLTQIVAKSSAGAIEHMAIAKVSNLADTLLKLKKEGLWIFAAEAGGTPYYDVDFKVPAVIVLGSEGEGVGRLIKDRSDVIVSIPMYGKVNSLNVSAAAAVILCHASRMQRE